MAGPEKNVENKIKADLIKHDAYFIKNYANGHTGKGHPDITANMKELNGKLLAFEIKKPIGGKPTPIQIKKLSQIAQNNGRAFITCDPETIDKIINNSNEIEQIPIKTALNDLETIWTKRKKETNIIEIIN